MKIDAKLAKDYPELAEWLKKNLPKVKKKNKVLTAFVKYSELTETAAKTALTAGTNPAIKFRIMPGANGEFEGGKYPDSVFIAKAICDRFKNDHNKKATKARMELLVESTVLHEMVHWGDWKDGKDQPGEEGKKFEKEAYGKDIDRYW